MVIFAIYCSLAVAFAADGTVEIKEDFIGAGEFQTFTNYDQAKDRALCSGDIGLWPESFLLRVQLLDVLWL